MFFFKKSEIIVDCFTSNEIVYNNFKIDKAREFIPNWWKQLPVNQKIRVNNDPNSKLTINQRNLKQCNGFIDLFTEGFIFPFWLDIQIEMLDDGKFYISGHSVPTVNIDVATHGRDQTGTSIYKECGQIKLTSPWFLEEKTGVKFSWNQCMWNNTSYLGDMHILPGVMDFKTQKTTNVNAFIKKGSIVRLDAGDPLVHLIPLSDKKITIQHHLLTQQEYFTKFNSEAFAGDYKNVKQSKNFREKSRCPFGFGK
jgi:hypothetical protein